MISVARYSCPPGLTEADAAAWVADLQARSDADEFFYSLNRYVVMATA